MASLYHNADTFTETSLLQRTLIQLDPIASSMLITGAGMIVEN